MHVPPSIFGHLKLAHYTQHPFKNGVGYIFFNVPNFYGETGMREYFTKQESFIQQISHWYKIVTVCLLFTIYLIIESNKNSFPAVLTLSKTYGLNLTRTKQI